MIRRYARTSDGNDGRGRPFGVAVAEVLEDGRVALGFSRCSDRDQFDRSFGNRIASARLNSRQWVVDDSWIESPTIVDEGFEDMMFEIQWVAQEALRRNNRVTN